MSEVNWSEKTLETYNRFAPELAEYFATIGPRTGDINRAFEFVKDTDQPHVLEIGCGDGRDALEIVAKTSNYIGIDPSSGMLDIARQKVPQGKFELSGAVEYDFPDDLDLIFAFASLLHLDKDDVKKVFDKSADALRSNGVFYVSVKYRPEYTEEVQTDKFGERMFYYYQPELIKELATERFDTIYEDSQKIGGTEWRTIALRNNK
jgi:SAM-dependent methyltransferase